MVHDVARGDKYRGPLYGSGPSPVGYRFGRGHVQGGPGRSALNRVSDWSKCLIAAIVDAKLRRMRRELEVRGIRFDQPDEAWIPSSLRDMVATNRRASHMARISPKAVFKAAFMRVIGRLLTSLFPSCYGPEKKYWREDHYMRGPGPAWRAKHGSDHTSNG